MYSRRTRAVPVFRNCLMSIFGWCECDLVHITSTHYAEVFEIKTSIADVKNEFCSKNDSKTYRYKFIGSEKSKIRKLWYALPKDVYDKTSDMFPDYAGIYIIDDKCIRKIKHAKSFKSAQPLNIKEMYSLLCMSGYRYWNIKLGRTGGRK